MLTCSLVHSRVAIKKFFSLLLSMNVPTSSPWDIIKHFALHWRTFSSAKWTIHNSLLCVGEIFTWYFPFIDFSPTLSLCEMIKRLSFAMCDWGGEIKGALELIYARYNKGLTLVCTLDTTSNCCSSFTTYVYFLRNKFSLHVWNFLIFFLKSTPFWIREILVGIIFHSGFSWSALNKFYLPSPTLAWRSLRQICRKKIIHKAICLRSHNISVNKFSFRCHF